MPELDSRREKLSGRVLCLMCLQLHPLFLGFLSIARRDGDVKLVVDAVNAHCCLVVIFDVCVAELGKGQGGRKKANGKRSDMARGEGGRVCALKPGCRRHGQRHKMIKGQ